MKKEKKSIRVFFWGRVIFVFMCFLSGLFPISFAQNLEIIPKADDQQKVINAVEEVGSAGGDVRNNYNAQAEKLANDHDIGAQMASGIMTRDTVLDYVAYLIKFLSQAGIFVGALMIIYAGYIYASHVFTGKEPSAGSIALKNAITGVIIIAFSYAIMKGIIAAFLS